MAYKFSILYLEAKSKNELPEIDFGIRVSGNFGLERPSKENVIKLLGPKLTNTSCEKFQCMF